MSDRTVWRLEAENERLRDEVSRLRLTDAERGAIEEAICDQESYIADCRKFHDPAGEQRAVQIGDTLRGLLKRTKGEER